MIPHCHTEDHQSSDFISIAKLWNFIPPCSQCCSPVTVLQWLAQADMVNVSLCMMMMIWNDTGTYGYATLLKPSVEVGDLQVV